MGQAESSEQVPGEEKELLQPAPRDAVDAVIAHRTLRFRFMQHDAWENALFVHWPVPVEVVKSNLPRGLEPDVLDGSAWVGLVLLTERGVSAHGSLGRTIVRPIDHLGANVRTYVKRNGIPGIFFWSLECSSWLASLGARMAGIPYFPATMHRTVDKARPVEDAGGAVASSSSSTSAVEASTKEVSDPGFTFHFSSKRSWAPGITPILGRSSSLPTVSAQWRLDTGSAPSKRWHEKARFFVERYSVYAAWPWGAGPLLLRGDVEHPEWKVQPVVLDELNAEPLMAAAGLPGIASADSTNEAQHACFSRGVGPVTFWMLEPV